MCGEYRDKREDGRPLKRHLRTAILVHLLPRTQIFRLVPLHRNRDTVIDCKILIAYVIILPTRTRPEALSLSSQFQAFSNYYLVDSDLPMATVILLFPT